MESMHSNLKITKTIDWNFKFFMTLQYLCICIYILKIIFWVEKYNNNCLFHLR